MKNFRLARLASLVCLAGGTIQGIYGLLAIPFGPYSLHAYGWDQGLWALANVAMIGAILGHLVRIVVSALIILRPSWDPTAPILVSILLMLLGMGSLGIATLLGKQMTGWWAWTPLLVPAVVLMVAGVSSINQVIHFVLLGLWGLPWMLVGYVIFTHAVKQEQVRWVQTSGVAQQLPDLTHPH